MMEYKLNSLLNTLGLNFTMLIMMLLPIIVVVGFVYLGLNLWERKTQDASKESAMPDTLLHIHKTHFKEHD
ncbi:MAG: hypothetical protein PHU36_00215 [Syntrophomonadaceae bacterium]|nr:hypothetical protein [Syntrophomonadaceae bacterium]